MKKICPYLKKQFISTITTMKKLINDNKTEITHIYHISDTHIRNTERHTEYKQVIDKTYHKLKKLIGTNNKKSLIVLTGDIVHRKTEMSPELIDTTSNFFKGLSDITDVILIPGNHDCNLSNKGRMDALTPIIANGNFKNIHYLKYSGVYQYHNIFFGASSLLDDYFVDAIEITDDMVNKPKQKNIYKIALYHGMLKGAKMDNGYVPKHDNLTIKCFKGYDYVMLGDIHTHQFVNSKKTIAYAGSLIQQTYGEQLGGHGFLEWILPTSEVNFVEIKNDYGFCTLDIKNGKLIKSPIPKNPSIRCILENTTDIEYEKIAQRLKKEYNVIEITSKSVQNYESIGYQKYDTENNIYNNKIKEAKIISFLKMNGLDKNEIKPLIRLHRNFERMIKNEDIQENNNSVKWKILELTFSNMLSYGPNNVIDFRKYDTNKIIGIVAPNRYGKSSILDVILFCIFDKFPRAARSDILNKNTNNMYCSLLLEIGNKKYFIERLGKKRKQSVKIDVRFYCITNDDNDNKIKEELTGLNKDDTNKIISKILGNYDDYLTSHIYTQDQTKNCDFANKTNLQKKEYLFEILNLGTFEKCSDRANTKLKKYNTQLKILKNEIDKISSDDIKNNIKTLTDKLNNLKNKKAIILGCLDVLNIEEILIKSPELIKYHELSEYKLNSKEEIIETIRKITKSMRNNNINEIQKNMQQHKKTLQYLKNDNSNDKKITALNTKLEELCLSIIRIPKNINELNIQDLKKNQLEIKSKISDINNKLHDSTHKLKTYKTNEISKIKNEISSLKKSIQFTDVDANNKLNTLIEKLKITQNELFDTSIHYFNNQPTGENTKNILADRLITTKPFAKHIKKTIEYLNLCTDDNIKPVLKLQNEWLNDYNKWYLNTTNKIKNSNTDVNKYEELHKNLHEYKKQIIEKSYDALVLYENSIINNKILELETELDIINDINNLTNNKKNLLEKLKLINESIANFDFYRTHLIMNIKTTKKIHQVKNDIAKLENNKINIKNEIKKSEYSINKCDEKINHINGYNEKFKLLHDFYFQFIGYIDLKIKYDNFINKKTKAQLSLNNIDNKINEVNSKIINDKKLLAKIKKTETKYNFINTKTNLCDSYYKMMNPNGIPYEILKSILPDMESNINDVLRNMVNFTIKFLFDKDMQKDDKILKTKIGTIDMNICSKNEKPKNVNLASGFEKFIINIAIRIVLCTISDNAKPNFIIIDEGWSCLDAENLSNIGSIMNYLRSQFEHVIIISHVQELKNQSDYILNISKNNGFSHVNNKNIKKIKHTKIKHTKIIEV